MLNYLSDRNGHHHNQQRAGNLSESVLEGGNRVVGRGNIQRPLGDFALYTFSKVTANICFLGVGGINEKGITTYALPETAVNRLIPGADERAAHRSGGRQQSGTGKQNFSTASISLITHLVTDRSADKEEIKKTEAKGVKVLYVTEVNVNGENEIRIEE